MIHYFKNPDNANWCPTDDVDANNSNKDFDDFCFSFCCCFANVLIIMILRLNVTLDLTGASPYELEDGDITADNDDHGC